MSTALVTGATAGIGNAFVRRLAADRYDLILVSRNEQRLEELAAELRTSYGVQVETLAADLADDAGCRTVEARLGDRDQPVDLLVNNAGFSVNSRFITGDVEDEERMLRVLVRAVLRLTRAALPGMLERQHGVIINVSSVAGFVPQGTYSAAKAWVTSFTQGLVGDLAGTGVQVLALCPGYTHTEFHERAELGTTDLPEFVWQSADVVVAAALRDLDRGRSVSIPGVLNQTAAAFSSVAPAGITRRVAGLVVKRSG